MQYNRVSRWCRNKGRIITKGDTLHWSENDVTIPIIVVLVLLLGHLHSVCLAEKSISFCTTFYLFGIQSITRARGLYCGAVTCTLSTQTHTSLYLKQRSIIGGKGAACLENFVWRMHGKIKSRTSCLSPSLFICSSYYRNHSLLEGRPPSFERHPRWVSLNQYPQLSWG